MEFSMKSIKGLLFIIASFLLTILTWMSTSPQFMIPGLALTSLSLTFILATRLPLLESWFHGLKKVYTATNSQPFSPSSYSSFITLVWAVCGALV